MAEKPTKKTYRSHSSAISVNLTMREPRGRIHLRFMPLSEGGSVFVTADRRLQNALEAHPRFGTLFTLDGVGSPPAAGLNSEAE